MAVPVPITDLAGLSAPVQQWLPRLVPALARTPGQVELWKDFAGHWRARARLAQGTIEFTLLRTPAGGILAWPTPLPARFVETGVPASDGTRWRQSAAGALVEVAGGE